MSNVFAAPPIKYFLDYGCVQDGPVRIRCRTVHPSHGATYRIWYRLLVSKTNPQP